MQFVVLKIWIERIRWRRGGFQFRLHLADEKISNVCCVFGSQIISYCTFKQTSSGDMALRAAVTGRSPPQSWSCKYGIYCAARGGQTAMCMVGLCGSDTSPVVCLRCDAATKDIQCVLYLLFTFSSQVENKQKEAMLI